ncbi:hypothetical protein [Sulfobacillus harzensis]|uniref:Uncharacterized protein n=1 Tax=Sulfobacillus harzensis TaxID=2729629 RepID=A0A7Y0L2U9_9FIRM|nr:hypothetical protein [Sulfobacillus harzensis]NMP22180.1 hypothetical protein [Sulfobacillus harzensis]
MQTHETMIAAGYRRLWDTSSIQMGTYQMSQDFAALDYVPSMAHFDPWID